MVRDKIALCEICMIYLYRRELNKMQNTYTEFGKKLKALRKIRRMTQEELAAAMNISKTSIVNYEHGARKIPLELIIKFAEFFKVSLDELIGLNIANRDKEHIIFSNSPRMIELTNRWYKEVGVIELTDDEMNDLIDYTKYLLYRRDL